MTPVYRLMERNEAPALYTIDQECFNYNWSLESYEKETNNILANYIVANYNGEVIGFGGFWAVIDEAQITNIGVLKKYRGQGVGDGILKAMIQRALEIGCPAMTLEVRENNEPAIALYRRNDFVVTGRREQYYDKNTDCIIMWRYHNE